MEPKPIEPQDIRVGDRVRATWHVGPATMSAEFIADYYADEKVYVKDSGSHGMSYSTVASTWTLLDRPKPDRPVGSHWRDPETGAEYVATDDRKCAFEAYSGIDRGDRDWHPGALHVGSDDDPIIARLTPIPAFDPAALWPKAERFESPCREDCDKTPEYCQRRRGHNGPHACYLSDGRVWFAWGDPR